ncbi:MAG: SusD/RagB family nutrient-binding outer membrane lipoprotein [Flavobacteriaceae bacterium]
MINKFIKIIYVIVGVIAINTMSSCSGDLEELNIDPDASNILVPEFFFTKAQLDAVNVSYFGTAALTIGGSMQHFSTYKEVPAAGDKYFNDGYSKAYFGQMYLGAVNEMGEVIRALEDPDDINRLSIARIWRTFIFHRITDLYGDVPYTEAGKGSSENLIAPKYDEQSFIYKDLLNELEQAINNMDSSLGSFGAGDLIYGGNLDQWKKFGYSMMLRLGMRLTEVDAALAETWVKKAIAGGVITNDTDLARIEYVDGSQVASRNPIASALLNGDYNNSQDEDNVEGGKFAKTFIDHLKNTKDPRLAVMAVVWVNQSGTYIYDSSFDLQIGMQNAEFNSKPPNFAIFSEPHPQTILKFDAPLLVFTSAEGNLLLAEAAIRGWYAGDAQSLYEDAVKSGMRQWSLFGDAGIIDNQDIEDYLILNPFKTAGSFEEKMEQIQTQKWVSLFLDEYEIFSNWRRTGYPALVPVNYPGNLTGGQIPTRFVLPESEQATNQVNFNEALDRQGGTNDFLSKVWWDK